MNVTVFGIGELSRLVGVPVWKVRRLFADGVLPEPARVGPNRVFVPEDVRRVRRALERAGRELSEVASVS